MRRRLIVAARIAVSVALLAWVAARLDPRAALAALARVHPSTLGLALALALAGYWGRALRWSYLLRHAGVSISNRDAYRLTLVGIGYGLVTPGRIGELARAFHLDVPGARALPSVIWDRLADIVLLEALSIPAFVALGVGAGGAPGRGGGPLLWAYLAVVLVTAAGMAALDSPRALAALARRIPTAAGWLGAWGGGATGVLRSAAFARGLLAGLFFYALNFAGAALLLSELAPAHPPQLTLLFPVIILLGNLPIAFGGLGLREQVSALAFARLGTAASVGPVFSLLWFMVVTVIPALIGFAIVPTRWGRARARIEHPARGATGAERPIAEPPPGAAGPR
jgi:hypothetical protein